MSDSFIMISEKGNIRRFRRGAEMFDPNAVDADGDGVVQEGTPFKRPAKPNVNIQIAPRRQSRFWDYATPKKPTEDLDFDFGDDVPEKPKHTPWREVNISPRGGPTPAEHLKPHEIVADDVTLDEWDAFKDALTDHLTEIRDDESVEKSVRRGMVKLFGAMKTVKARKNEDGKLQLTMSDAERARIIKGIYSMNKRNMEMPNMKIISEMLKAVEKKSAFVRTNASVGRPFAGVRYKQASSFRHIVSPSVETHPIADFTSRQSGFRLKGEMPRQGINIKALGRTLAGGGAGRRSGRYITESFDPNAYDADGDGLVQDSTPFERPAMPRKPQLLKPMDIDRSFGNKKPQRPNSVLKAQADRKAMNFNIERLRSTLRRVGSDYVPKWWDTSDNEDFKKKISAASPEELSEIFARIYVERRSLMTAKVGRSTTGSIKVFADHRDAVAKQRGDMLKKRGEDIYKEMFSRIVNPDSDPKTLKKQFAQFNNWWQLTADNSDWYFEQSFKITKKKRRRKLAITSPVDRRGREWAEDPQFTEDAAKRVLESIETDIRRANPSISDQSARRSAERIIKDRDRRLSRTPNKTPRVGENRDIVPRGRVRTFNGRMKLIEPRKNTAQYYDNLLRVAPYIQNVDHAPALKNMTSIIAANEQKFGQMQTFDDFKKAFKTLGPDIRIDLFRSRYSNRNPSDYEKTLLHTYLHTMQVNPEMLNFPIEIRKQSAAETYNGVGGSHTFIPNFIDPTKPAFRHVFLYSGEADVKQQHVDIMDSINQSNGLTTIKLTDGITNQIVKDYLNRNLRPNMTQSEKDDVIEKASQLEVYSTALHESGHGVHAANMAIDYFGKKTQPQIMQEIQATLDGYTDDEFKRNARGLLYDEIKREINPLFDQLDEFTQTSGVINWQQYYKTFASGKNPDASLNPNQILVAHYTLSKYGQNAKEALAAWSHIAAWKSDRSKYDIVGMENFISKWQADVNVSQLDLPIVQNLPIQKNGKFDVAKLRDKNNVFFRTTSSDLGTFDYSIYNRMLHTQIQRLPNSKFEYDSLSPQDVAIAAPALEKLSEYAARTSKYGAGAGTDSNVESIAELNAASLSGVIASKGFSAEEIRVINLLVDWLQRTKS